MQNICVVIKDHVKETSHRQMTLVLSRTPHLAD